MITYGILAENDIAPYAALLPAGQQHLLAQVGAEFLKHVVIGACQGETVLGVAIVRLNRLIKRAFLVFITTEPSWRRQGIATQLLRELDAALRVRGIEQVQATYTVDADQPAPIEDVLVQAGWQPQTNHLLMTWQLDTGDDALLARYWRETPAGQIGRAFPADSTPFAWTEALTDADRALLAAYLEAYPTEVSSLYPAYDGNNLFPTSLGLRVDGRLAGWLIIHERPGQALRFTMLYLHPDYRGRRLGLKLINEGVARTFALCRARSRASGSATWEWQAQSVPGNQLMLAFYDLTGPLLTRRQAQRVALKMLTPPGARRGDRTTIEKEL